MYKQMPLIENVEEMFIGPFGSSLKNECFVDKEDAFCMVYEQKHAIQKSMNVETRYVNESKYKELQRFNVHGGDIIVSCRGTIGETYIVPDDAPLGIMHPSIMKIRLKNNVYDKYYFNLLLTARLKLHEVEANGSGVKMAISASALGKEYFPVPALNEQQEIAETIAKIQRIIKQRKQQLSTFDQLIKARFVEEFGDHYQEDTLLNLCNIIDYRGKTPEKAEDGLPFITAKNVRMHQMSLEPREYISKETYDKVMVRGFPKEGDVVFTTEAPLGNVCRIPHFNTEFYIGQRIVTLQTEKLNPTYLEYALSTEEFKRKYMGKSSGSTVTGIRVRLLEQLTIPVPPHDLQNQFADFVAQVDKSKAVVQQALAKDQLLFDSLMQQYFG